MTKARDTADINSGTNTAAGEDALENNTASNNTAVGYQAGYSFTTGGYSTVMGYQAAQNATAGGTVAIGHSSAKNNTGAGITAVGSNALVTNTSGTSSTGIGANALNDNTTGSSNVALGRDALYSNTTASNNTSLGYRAGYNLTNAGGQTGRNTFVGMEAGYNSNGDINTFVGQGSGSLITSGRSNTILGRYTGNQGGLDIRTSSNNIVLSDGDGNPRHYVNASGDQAFSTVDMTTSNGSVGRTYAYEAPSNNLCNIYHLNSASHQVIFEARRNGRTNERMSQINIGENGSSQGEVTIFSSTANANLSGGVVVANGATSWSSASDTRLKTITGTYDNALQDIANIEPIKFTWKADSTNQPNVGVSAQSVQAVVPEAVDARKNLLTPDDETEYLSVKYTELIPLMIASIQELSAKNDALEARLATLEG